MGRKAISKSVRFSVFARDGFTCRYCGRKSDQVRLVIDHLVPVAKGGDSEESNLITACEPCNQGKGSKLIPATSQIESHRLSLAQEFQEQKKMHKRAVKAAKLKGEIRTAICNKYCEVFHVPSILERTLSHYVSICGTFGPELLFEWFQIAADKDNLYGETNVLKYIHGIKRRYLEESNATTIS